MKILTKILKLLRGNIPFVLLIIGTLFMVVPSRFPEFKPLYVFGVWIWPFCFLYYGRFSRKRFNQAILFIFLAVGLCLRFKCVLGQGFELESVLLMVFAACAFWVPFAWDARYYSTNSSFVYTLVFPMVYGTLNWILSACNVIPVCNLAYAQYDNKPILQLVSVVGEFGLTFFITWVASIAVYICDHWNTRGGRRLALIVVAVLAGVHVWGAARYFCFEESKDFVMIAQANGPKLEQKNGMWEIQPYERNLESFNRIVRSAKELHADMLVFNEEAFTILDTNEFHFVANATAMAKEFSLPILLGLEVDPSPTNEVQKLTDKLILIDREGIVVTEYLRRNTVPAVEADDVVMGDGNIPTVPLDIGNGNYQVSFVICYDGNFTDYTRTMDPSTQIYFNPAWDWEAINDFHYRTIGIRSVEMGVNLVMTTYDGWSIVSDPVGKELLRMSAEETGYEKVFMSKVPTKNRMTVYPKVGGFINLVYPVASLFIIAIGQMRRKDDDEEDEEEKVKRPKRRSKPRKKSNIVSLKKRKQ